MRQSAKFPLASLIFEDLTLRDSAVRLFEAIERSPEDCIVIDFEDVRSMSRSFADEYFVRRSSSTKAITEVNVPENVRRMIETVSDRSGVKKRLDISEVSTSRK